MVYVFEFFTVEPDGNRLLLEITKFIAPRLGFGACPWEIDDGQCRLRRSKGHGVHN